MIIPTFYVQFEMPPNAVSYIILPPTPPPTPKKIKSQICNQILKLFHWNILIISGLFAGRLRFDSWRFQ